MFRTILDYSNYTFTDFMLDEDFKQWVIQPDKHNGAYWKQVVAENPHLVLPVKKAIAALLKFKHYKAHIEKAEVERMLRLIYEEM